MNIKKLSNIVCITSVIAVAFTATVAAMAIYKQAKDDVVVYTTELPVLIMDVHGDHVYVLDIENQKSGAFDYTKTCNNHVLRMAIGEEHIVAFSIIGIEKQNVFADFSKVCLETYEGSLNNTTTLKTINPKNV